MTTKRLLPCLAALLLLAGCGAPRYQVNTDRTMFLSGYYQYGAGDRDLQLVVRGNPYPGLAKDEFDKIIEADAARGGLLQPPTRPRLHPDDSAKKNFSMVLAFNPVEPLDPQDLCDNRPSADAQSPEGDLTIIAAFCVSGKAVSHSTAWITTADPRSPALAKLIAGVKSELFRPDDAVQASGGDSGPQ